MARPSAKNTFTTLVKAAVAQHLPAYAFYGSTSESGPQVHFLRPALPGCDQLRERLSFIKARSGAEYFRVHYWMAYEGPGKGGTLLRYEVALGIYEADSRSEFEAGATLEDWMPTHLDSIDRQGDALSRPFRAAYSRIHALHTDLLRLYREWYDARPKHLESFRALLMSLPDLHGEPDELFIHKNFPYPDKALSDRRFESFREHLVHRNVLTGVEDPAGTFLRGFWERGRPLRKDDFGTDKFVGNPCSVCAELKTRGKFVEKADVTFGSYLEFLCARCSTSGEKSS